MRIRLAWRASELVRRKGCLASVRLCSVVVQLRFFSHVDTSILAVFSCLVISFVEAMRCRGKKRGGMVDAPPRDPL